VSGVNVPELEKIGRYAIGHVGKPLRKFSIEKKIAVKEMKIIEYFQSIMNWKESGMKIGNVNNKNDKNKEAKIPVNRIFQII